VLAQGDPIQWALAAHALAISNTYVIPADHQLAEEYVTKNFTVVVEQLGSAGVRLAAILNSVLGNAKFNNLQIVLPSGVLRKGRQHASLHPERPGF
jgi:hypothetical protein